MIHGMAPNAIPHDLNLWHSMLKLANRPEYDFCKAYGQVSPELISRSLSRI